MRMSMLNILLKDIKLTNIFIDVNGGCKGTPSIPLIFLFLTFLFMLLVGDFGVTTSTLSQPQVSWWSTLLMWVLQLLLWKQI